MIPMMDLSGQNKRVKAEILAAIDQVIEQGAFIQGPFVTEFETAFKRLHQLPFGAGCSNGTSAISIALSALGVGPGDEVITVPSTFIATAEAISNVGATPVLVDIHAETYGMDATRLEAAITRRTKAVIPVHLYGNPNDMDPILEIARARRLKVIEDCAQAHFATYKGRMVGTFGDAATFSFFPGKNLGAFGDAGFVVSRTDETDRRCRMLIDHGRCGKKYEHEIIGSNHRMDGMQAAVLSVKLRHIEEWTAIRRRNAKIYDDLLAPTGIQKMQPTPGSDPVYHLYVVQVSNRAETIDRLAKKGIGTGIHYPIPIHLQPAYRGLDLRAGAFPVAERLAERALSLPMCGELAPEKIEQVVRELKEIARP